MNRIFRSAASLALAGTAVLGACRSDSGRDAGSVQDSAGQRGTQMSGGMMGSMTGGMMDSMQTHMRMMDGMSADQMKGTLPMHRQMAANMLSQLNGEMRTMNMSADAKWNALADSIRQDLVRMPDMSANELKSFMPAHGGRMMRLMQMHRAMMGDMKM